MKNVDVVLEGALAQKVAEEGAAVVVEKTAPKLLTKVATLPFAAKIALGFGGAAAVAGLAYLGYKGFKALRAKKAAKAGTPNEEAHVTTDEATTENTENQAE